MATTEDKHPIEVKIGVQYSPRELTVEVDLDPQAVADLVSQAVVENGVIALTDTRGRQVLVPGDRCSYVEIGPSQSRRVGFGAD